MLPRIGSVLIASLTSGDVQRLLDGIAAERTPEHARKALTALRVALRVAERYGELPVNPCAWKPHPNPSTVAGTGQAEVYGSP